MSETSLPETAVTHELFAKIADKILAVGTATFRLYQQGEIQQPELAALCAELAALENPLAASPLAADPDLTPEDSPDEPIPESTTTAEPEPTAPPTAVDETIEAVIIDDNAPTTCTNCGRQLRPGLKFCTNCGSPVISRSQPVAPRSQPAAPAPTINMPTTPTPTTPPETSASRSTTSSTADAQPTTSALCSGCGRPLLAEAVFCTNCGQAINPAG